MKRRGMQVRNPEMFASHGEAAAFMDEADAWLRRTDTAWSHLCRMAQVQASVRSSVRTIGNGMLRKSIEDLRTAMQRHPDGITPEDVGVSRALLPWHETLAFAEELKRWLAQTDTAPWRLAEASGRTGAHLVRWIADPRPISPRVAARIRDVMAANPQGMGSPVQERTLRTAPPPPPLIDPLAERRGEAERQRQAWIARQAAEHQRKYGCPLGRPIEEMAA